MLIKFKQKTLKVRKYILKLNLLLSHASFLINELTRNLRGRRVLAEI